MGLPNRKRNGTEEMASCSGAGSRGNVSGNDAQRIAAAMGHEVTPAEILATAGNETHYGDLTYPMVRNGNFFGLHGSGPAGTYYTTGYVTDPPTGMMCERGAVVARAGFSTGAAIVR